MVAGSRRSHAAGTSHADSPGPPGRRWLLASVIALAAPGLVWPSGETVVVNGIGTLPPGKTVVIRFQATVNNPLPAGISQVSNQGTVSGTNFSSVPTDDPDQGGTADPTVTPISAAPDLAITKDDGLTQLTPGQTTVYALGVSNLGNQAATGVIVTDVVPAGTSFNALSSTPGWSCPDGAPAGTVCTFTIGALGAASMVVNFAVTVNIPPGVTEIVNTASIADDGANGPDPVPGNNTATDTDTVVTDADLSITKTDGQATAMPGAAVTYTIVAASAGPASVIGATVGDTVPVALTGVTWTCVGSGGGTCTASGSGDINDTVSLPAGSSVTYSLTGTVSPAATGSLTNTATVTVPAGITDPVPANNSATDTDVLIACGSEIVIVPDGRLTSTVVPAGASAWFAATLRIGGSYSVEFQNASGDGTPPGTLTVFSGDDGCSGTSTLAVTDTTGIDPAAPAATVRASFTAAGAATQFRARLVNSSGAPVPLVFGWSETTMFSPAWSTSSSFDTFYSLQNTTRATIDGTLTLLDASGVTVASFPLTVPAGQSVSANTASLGVPRDLSGSARFVHDGPPGALILEAAIANFSLNPAYVQPVLFRSVRENR